MEEIKVPGKAILAGEHAVVYDKHGIAFPVELYTRVSVREGEEEKLTIANKNFKRVVSIPLEKVREIDEEKVLSFFPELSCVARIAKKFDIELHPMKIEISTELPISSGLGSSASLSIAISKIFFKDEEEVIAAAMECERLFHGNPSGIDVLTEVYSRGILFRRSAGVVEFLDLPKDIKKAVIYTHRPLYSTRELVERVRKHRDRDRIIEEIDRIVLEIKEDIENFSMLKKLVEENHRLLSLLGVSTDEVDKVCRKINALPRSCAKISGAGGGGIVIALTEDEGELRNALKSLGYVEDKNLSEGRRYIIL